MAGCTLPWALVEGGNGGREQFVQTWGRARPESRRGRVDSGGWEADVCIWAEFRSSVVTKLKKEMLV